MTFIDINNLLINVCNVGIEITHISGVVACGPSNVPFDDSRPTAKIAIVVCAVDSRRLPTTNNISVVCLQLAS